MFMKFSTELLYPLCRLGMHQLRNTFFGIRLSRKSGDTFSPSWWKWPSYIRETRKTQSRVNKGYTFHYIRTTTYERRTYHEGIHVQYSTWRLSTNSRLIETCSARSQKNGGATRWRTYADTEAILSSWFGVPRAVTSNYKWLVATNM